MENLLDMVEYEKIYDHMHLSEAYETERLLRRFIEDNAKDGIRWVAVLAYMMGVRQGIHKERSKRKSK